MLDASAVLAWVLHEDGAEVVEQVLAVGVAPASVMVETLYRAQERGHRSSSSELHDDLMAMGLAVEPVTDADTVRAAALIASSRRARSARSDPSLSLGDGLCIAVAERLDLPLVGSDGHWASLDLATPYRPFR